MPPPLLIAHRGESCDAPENTLAAVQLAWTRGARAVEVDVRLSADGEAFVIHDSTTRRIGGPAAAVARQTATELRGLDAGRWKASRWAGERIPFLREILETVPASGRLFVELKEGPESVAPVLSVWERTPQVFAPQLTFMSFRPETIEELSRACDRDGRRAAVCFLLEKKTWRQPNERVRALRFARELRLCALNLEVGAALDRALISRIQEEGLQVFCWTVNRVATARRLFEAGIDGVTTDRCAWMRAQLENDFA
jgi:glycerophosphoryl diester phosphodiesterase